LTAVERFVMDYGILCGRHETPPKI
jgi:hypothetical protein